MSTAFLKRFSWHLQMVERSSVNCTANLSIFSHPPLSSLPPPTVPTHHLGGGGGGSGYYFNYVLAEGVWRKKQSKTKQRQHVTRTSKRAQRFLRLQYGGILSETIMKLDAFVRCNMVVLVGKYSVSRLKGGNIPNWWKFGPSMLQTPEFESCLTTLCLFLTINNFDRLQSKYVHRAEQFPRLN